MVSAVVYLTLGVPDRAHTDPHGDKGISAFHRQLTNASCRN